MNDNYLKAIFTGILVCLVIIAFKPNQDNYIQTPPPNVSINDNDQIIQIGPNLIGVLDRGTNSGIQQLVVFEYIPEKKTFDLRSTLNYQEYLTHPEKYGIPSKTKNERIDEKKKAEDEMSQTK